MYRIFCLFSVEVLLLFSLLLHFFSWCGHRSDFVLTTHFEYLISLCLYILSLLKTQLVLTGI